MLCASAGPSRATGARWSHCILYGCGNAGRAPSWSAVRARGVQTKTAAEPDAEATPADRASHTAKRKKRPSPTRHDGARSGGRQETTLEHLEKTMPYCLEMGGGTEPQPVRLPAHEARQPPRLAHGLDRVLFNPGVYYLQDPRTSVYNFDPYLQELMPNEEFNFEALEEYVTSSKDTKLHDMAKETGAKFTGSTSTLTGALSQLHHLISNWRPLKTSRLSQSFRGDHRKQFASHVQAPAAVYLRYRDGVYAIDADKSGEMEGGTILSLMGKSMERLLTSTPEHFEQYRKRPGTEGDAEAANSAEKEGEIYHYTQSGSLLMRSQLDCYDARLPGEGVFDLKTRATLGIRLNILEPEIHAGYQITSLKGLFQSFEREYSDMMRNAFLKYSLQTRIGRMDGIFVAYHNTERIFGFQYISQEEMDECLHGNAVIAEKEYRMSLELLNDLLEEACARYPETSMRIVFQAVQPTGASSQHVPMLQMYIEPMSEEQVEQRQTTSLYTLLYESDTLNAMGRDSRGALAELIARNPVNDMTVVTVRGANVVDRTVVRPGEAPYLADPASRWRFFYRKKRNNKAQNSQSLVDMYRKADNERLEYLHRFNVSSLTAPSKLKSKLLNIAKAGRQQIEHTKMAQANKKRVVIDVPRYPQ